MIYNILQIYNFFRIKGVTVNNSHFLFFDVKHKNNLILLKIGFC